MMFLIELLRKRTDPSPGAPEFRINDFLMEFLRKLTDPCPGAPELRINAVLNRIIKEADRSESGSCEFRFKLSEFQNFKLKKLLLIFHLQSSY